MAAPPAAIFGRLEIALSDVRDYRPPRALFADAAAAGVATAPSLRKRVDHDRSSWRVVELGPAEPRPVPSRATVQQALDRLVEAGHLSVHGGRAARLPTAAELLADLEPVVDDFVAKLGDEGARGALLSERFLLHLAHERIRELRAAHDARSGTAAETAAAAAASERKRTERPGGGASAATDVGAPSLDPWDPDANDPARPSIAAARLLSAELPAELDAVLAELGAPWKAKLSRGEQTSILVPGANSTRPEAEIGTSTDASGHGTVVVVEPSDSAAAGSSSSSLSVAALVVASGPHAGKRVALSAHAVASFGRPAADPSVMHDLAELGASAQLVATRHFAVVAVNGSYRLLNYSRNGVLVRHPADESNGGGGAAKGGKWHIATPVTLRHGDVLRTAGVDLRLDVASVTTVSSSSSDSDGPAAGDDGDKAPPSVPL